MKGFRKLNENKSDRECLRRFSVLFSMDDSHKTRNDRKRQETEKVVLFMARSINIIALNCIGFLNRSQNPNAIDALVFLFLWKLLPFWQWLHCTTKGRENVLGTKKSRVVTVSQQKGQIFVTLGENFSYHTVIVLFSRTNSVLFISVFYLCKQERFINRFCCSMVFVSNFHTHFPAHSKLN